MDIHSVKFKITCWYTGIIALTFGLVLVGAFWYAKYYGESIIKEELLDEVGDLEEDILLYASYLPLEHITSYFDDGVMLSVYDEDQHYIDGSLPDEFPEHVPLKGERGPRKLRKGDENWFIYDRRLELSDGETVWIRGVHSYSSLVVSNQRMVSMLLFVFPLLVIFTAFIGYRMLMRALRPVSEVTQTANDITVSLELSRRIPMPHEKNELYDLCATVNRMLESLELNFQRERQFSSDAAHELRTPVSVILSHCEYCLEELSLTAEEREEILIIQRKAQQMSELVSSLLMISRGENKQARIEKEPVDLKLLAETVSEELEEKAAEKQITIEVDNSLKDPVIQADMSMMMRLFINLTDNAITYGNPGGYIRISMTEEGEMVSLKFSDNGIGIPKEDLEKIWDRFYQVDASHSGESFGLGLFLVRQIVTRHKGTITVESELGKGSTFTVRLPRQ